MPVTEHPDLFALLIGIDRYSQTPLSDGSYFPHLGGCVRDINHVEQMLRNSLNLPDERIIKLTSPNPPDDPDAAAQLPTYKNLVEAFRKVTDLAKKGDQVYIHYSGHGGRSVTMFPELKGADGLDESLVPCDIGANGACYLRDIEMAYLLKAMSEKGLLVTLVLDSCHSGGATRGSLMRRDGRGAVRGKPDFIDKTPPLEQSAVADKVELVNAFRQMPPAATRGVNAASGWSLPTPKNFVLLAACRANELANEYAFDGAERNGALTYWMLDALKQIGEGYTYRMLYNRVVAKVHSKFVDQTPQLEGDGSREIFGGGQRATHSAVNVSKVDLPNNRVQLNTGLAQGVGKGAQFAVYPADTTDFKNLKNRLAVVELEDAGATETWAQIVEADKIESLREGAQAILLGIGIRLRGRVRLVRTDVFDEAAQDAALEKLRAVIAQANVETAADEKWIRLAAENEETNFQVAVNFHGEYEVWDASGAALPNLRPALSISDKDAAAQIAQRLVHLTKYRNARLIDNTDPTSPLARKIVAELGTMESETDAETGEQTGKEIFRPFGLQARPLSVGETAYLRVTNLSKTAVNLTIMDLQPDWGISQMYPDAAAEMDYDLLESGAGNALLLPMTAWLPDDYQEGADTLKVFAVVEGTSFHWLEMPALDQPPAAPKGSPAVDDALEQLMTAFNASKLTRQMINMSAPKGRSWATTQVEIQIRRSSIGHVADPALSMLQSAFDEVIAKKDKDIAEGGVVAASRSVNGQQRTISRPELNNSIINEITQYSVAVAQDKISADELIEFDASKRNAAVRETQERGAVDTVKYCASMAVGLAKNLWAAKVRGDTVLYNQYKDALEGKFTDCDLHYQEAITQFLKFVARSGQVAYRRYANLNDYVIDGRLPDDATVGIVADWGTGEPEALEVLQQVKAHNPQVAIHLGDVYYAGTDYEVKNYFEKPWTEILELNTSKILSLALPGNHDLYSGGAPYYNLLDRLAVLNGFAAGTQLASYFCLRNDNWQLIGMDTALHDRLGGKPTRLENSEKDWIIDKIQNADGRRTILLSHHQLFSANDQFDGKSYNETFYNQLAPVLPQVDLWLWGHEHDLVVFGKYMNLERGRCIGGSAFPVGNFEMPATRANPDVPVNQQVQLSKGNSFYSHCYTILKLDGANAIVSYYEDNSGRLLFQETL